MNYWIDLKKNLTELEEELQYFIMDLLMDMFEIHYDTRWTVSNVNKEELKMRLSKQKRKRKATINSSVRYNE